MFRFFRRKRKRDKAFADAVWDEDLKTEDPHSLADLCSDEERKEIRAAQEEQARQEIRRSSFDGWLNHAIGTVLSDNPVPDILENMKDGLDKISVVGELRRLSSAVEPEPLAGCVKALLEEQLAAFAQLRVALSPLERALRGLVHEHETLDNGEYLRWLSPEGDLLDYDPNQVREMLDQSPHRKEDEDSAR